MGGNAFRQSGLPEHSFPRMHPSVYKVLKVTMMTMLKPLYGYIEVPAEAPAKVDHGDLDLVVALPHCFSDASTAASSSSASESQAQEVKDTSGPFDTPSSKYTPLEEPHTPEAMQNAIGAAQCVGRAGYGQTSNFAITINRGEWGSFGAEFVQLEQEAREHAEKMCGVDTIRYQVDIHVCRTMEELRTRLFFNAYGDLGMIMGLVVANIGLKLSCKGLWYPNQPHRTLLLSANFEEICTFMGWSFARHGSGGSAAIEFETAFSSNEEAFEWIAESRFYDCRHFRTKDVPGMTKMKPERKMYAAFVRWSEERRESEFEKSQSRSRSQRVDTENAREEALVHFGKKAELDALMHDFELRAWFSKTFTGTHVGIWTGLGQAWREVKVVMDLVRAEHDTETLRDVFDQEGEDGLKNICVEAKERIEKK